jgi:GNAT superfamily N-acetyltransferase
MWVTWHGRAVSELDGLTVRVATLDDLPAIERGIPARPGAHEARLRRSAAGESTVVVAWIFDVVVGRGELLWEPKEADVRHLHPGVPELNGLDVAEEWRNRGIGTAMVEHAVRLAAGRGCAEIGLGVGLENPAAYRLYRRLGFDGDLEYADRYVIVVDDKSYYFADPCRFLTRATTGRHTV